MVRKRSQDMEIDFLFYVSCSDSKDISCLLLCFQQYFTHFTSAHKYSSFMVLAADIQGHRGGIIFSSSISILAVINLCKPRIYCSEV